MMDKKILIAGPCAAESHEQLADTAKALREVLCSLSSAQFEPVLRAGLWKPRSSPSTFQGIGAEGLPWLVEAAAIACSPAATEVAQPEHLTAAYEAGIRHFWIGARTTSNPFMVEALADTPIADKQEIVWYIKNPTSPDIDLWVGAVERLRRAGYRQLRAIHRGFAMGEHTTSIYRNAPLWSVAIEFKRRYADIPLLTDASHIAGQAERVAEIAEQAMRMGMDGLMIEVHSHPDKALSDARQQLTPEAFAQLMLRLTAVDISAHDGDSTELASLRQQIDETDDELWALLSKRMNISQQIGKYKREHNMPVLQRTRYNELLRRRMQWAEQHGIDPEAAKQIMDIIHEQSVLRQV